MYAFFSASAAIAVAHDPASLLRQEISYMEGKQEDEHDDQPHDEQEGALRNETEESDDRNHGINADEQKRESSQASKRPGSQVSGAQAVLGAMGL